MDQLAAARSLIKSGKKAEAAKQLTKILTDNPDHPEALFLIGQLLMDEGQHPLALAVMQKLTFTSDDWKHWMVLGACECALQRPTEARAAIGRGLKQQPGSPELQRLMSHVCISEYDFEGAREWAEKSLEREEHPQGHVCKAFADLHEGNWETGWAHYHKGLGHMKWRDKHDYGLPEWNGEPGKLLVYPEQGLGDQIAYLGAIKEHEDDVNIINCHPKVANLIRRSFPETQVYGDQFKNDVNWAPAADFQINMAGAMQYYRQSPKAANPFLVPHEGKKKQWKALLSDLPHKKKIGIAWTGGMPGSHGSRSRDLSLEQLMPLFKQVDADFISLEYKDCGEELAALKEKHDVSVHHFDWATCTNDLDDFAALQANLDAIVCVPTTAYHIAGGLGQPAFVLVHDTPHFHEALAFDKSPWWDTVELIRRPTLGDNGAVLEAVKRLKEVL